jgi:uncharacterized SAM-binding protein YcdF (DUF218 family)
MLFFLRRLAEAMLLPIGLSGMLVIAGIAVRRRSIAAIGIIALYLFSTPIADRLLTQTLERVYRPEEVAAAPNADAIVVLSGGIVRGVAASGVQWGDSANRYFSGFDLLVAAKAKFIVFTTAPTDDSRNPNQGAILRQVAIRHGIRPESIILTPRVLTTEDEARAVSAIPGLHSVLLVTSAFHMPRAALLFRARGLNVLPFPTDQRVLGSLELNLLSLIPGAAHLHGSEQALREYYGLAVYHVLLFFRPMS